MKKPNTPASKTSDKLETQHQEWVKNRDDAFEQVCKDQSEYDKQLLTLSSGFLAVSLAFIKDIVPLGNVVWPSILHTSFCLFATCIVVVLFSYQFSIAANLKVKDYWDKTIAGYEDAKFPNLHAVLVNWLNRVSGIIFVAGVIAIVAFVIINLRNEAKMSHDQSKPVMARDGAFVKVPYQGDTAKKGQNLKTPPPRTSQPKNVTVSTPKKP